MKVRGLVTSVVGLVLAMGAIGAGPMAQAEAAKPRDDAPAAAPKWEPRQTGRRIKSWTRHPAPRVPQRGEPREALCLTPRALRAAREAKAPGFEATSYRSRS